MSAFEMIIRDPVVWGSILGIAVVCGICSYYVWYFISHVVNDQ